MRRFIILAALAVFAAVALAATIATGGSHRAPSDTRPPASRSLADWNAHHVGASHSRAFWVAHHKQP